VRPSPGAYKIPGFNDIPESFNVKLLRDAEWPQLTSIHSSKGVGEPPFFLGASVAIALRKALLSSRQDGGFSREDQLVPFNFPMTSERLRNESGDWLAKKGRVVPKEGEKGKEWFVRLA
jgi:xanthine dehydrogenase/oxidase